MQMHSEEVPTRTSPSYPKTITTKALAHYHTTYRNFLPYRHCEISEFGLWAQVLQLASEGPLEIVPLTASPPAIFVNLGPLFSEELRAQDCGASPSHSADAC